MNLTNYEIAEYIKNMRKAAGLTQKQLAAMLNIPVSALSKYEQAVKRPPQLEGFLKQLRTVVCNIIKSRREAKS